MQVKMSIQSLLIIFLDILAALGLAVAVVYPIVSLIHWMKMKKLRKKIPDKIKQEVENARIKKQFEIEQARIRYGTGEQRIAAEVGRDAKGFGFSDGGEQNISGTSETAEDRSLSIQSSAVDSAAEQLNGTAERHTERHWAEFS